jgi:hypothetical protein
LDLLFLHTVLRTVLCTGSFIVMVQSGLAQSFLFLLVATHALGKREQPDSIVDEEEKGAKPASNVAFEVDPKSPKVTRNQLSTIRVKSQDLSRDGKETYPPGSFLDLQSDPAAILNHENCELGTHIFSDLEGEDMTRLTKLMEVFNPKPSGYENDDTKKYSFDQGIPYLKNANLPKGKCLVFLGDVLDSAGNKDASRQFVFRTALTLIDLKTRFNDQVLLIIGNRDANKMRLMSELVLPSSIIGPFYWLAAAGSKDAPSQVGFDVEKPWQAPWKDACFEQDAAFGGPLSVGKDRRPAIELRAACKATGERLKKILGDTMGAGAAFEAFRKEISLTKTEGDPKVSDQEVVDFVLESVQSGIMREYIKLAHIIGAEKLKDDKYSLFLHGSLHPDLFQDGLRAPQESKLLLPLDFGLKVKCGDKDDASCSDNSRDAKPLDGMYEPMQTNDVAEWVQQWAKWKQHQYKEWSETTSPADFIKRWGGGRTVAATRPAAELMDMGLGTLGGTYRNAGHFQASPIVEFRWGQHPKMMEDVKEVHEGHWDMQEFAKHLTTFGITRVFVGHFCEPGKFIPEIYKYPDGLEVANMDITFKESFVAPLKFLPLVKLFGDKGNPSSEKSPDTKDTTFGAVMQPDGTITITGTVGADKYDVVPVWAGKDATGADSQTLVLEGGGKLDELEFKYGSIQKEDREPLWKADKGVANLRAYPVAKSGTRIWYKVNHKSFQGNPPAATWYYQSKDESKGSDESPDDESPDDESQSKEKSKETDEPPDDE